MSEDEMKVLIRAHWNEFLIEEAIRTQGGDIIGREADGIGQLQLAIHKLERAKLEVAYYSNAISKAADCLRAACRSHTVTGGSGSPTTKAILISHQVGL